MPCRVWYTVLPLRDTVLLEVDDFSAEEIAHAAQPGIVIELPQERGLRVFFICAHWS